MFGSILTRRSIILFILSAIVSTSTAYARPSAIIQPPADGGGSHELRMQYSCYARLPINGSNIDAHIEGSVTIRPCLENSCPAHFEAQNSGLFFYGVFDITSSPAPGIYNLSVADIEVSPNTPNSSYLLSSTRDALIKTNQSMAVIANGVELSASAQRFLQCNLTLR